MLSTPRRLSPLVIFVITAGLAVVIDSARPMARQDPAGPTSMTDASAPTPPDQVAFDAAMRLPKPIDRLVALDKVRKDYPQSRIINTIDAQILAGVLQTPDSADAASEVLDRMLARIPSSASPADRFAATIGPVSQMVGRKVLLDRAEQLLTDVSSKITGSTERARSHYEMARIAAARGDMGRAETEYRAAAAWPPAVSALVSLYSDRGEKEQAETFLLEVVKATPVNMAAVSSLTNLYKNDPAKAKAILKDAVSRDPQLPTALLSLARIEQQSGEDPVALDHFLKAASMLYLRGPDNDALRALYTKVHGSADKLEDDINERYKALPKALTPAKYTPTAQRSDRVVVLEMFTGSACPPCVAADLAFDAALDRYPSDSIVPLSYHQHIPGPDPMVTSEGNQRRGFYGINGVPTMEIDGAMVAGPDGGTFGGGGRANAPMVFDKYTGLIDAALESPARAALAVKAAIAGDKVTATVDVSKLPAGASGLRLHVVLAERELYFGGENGVRGHAMVVRGIAGEGGNGLALSATGAVQQVFDLAAIRTDITRNLAAEIGARSSGGGGGSFAADGHPMTKIDPAHLMVVAFIQGADKKILQGARADVR